jgi:hypothetical protein
MGEYDLHSLILACDFRVGLAAIGGAMRDVSRSRAIFEWFDISGVAGIPPVFGGEAAEKIDLYAPSPEDQVGRVVIAVVSSILRETEDEFVGKFAHLTSIDETV